jgi:hypothetical protein
MLILDSSGYIYQLAIYQLTFEYLLQIIPAPPRLGEDEPPPSWDLVPSPRGDSILS